MLSNLKLPQKLASPLGLLVNDPKLAFRTQPNGIRKLAEVRGIKRSDSYWDQYTTLFDSPSDVFSLISSNDIRRAVVDAPENVETLITLISERLFSLLVDHTFPSSASAVAALASSFIKSAASTAGVANTERNSTKEALNCLRVLSRVLPILFESENTDLELRIMLTSEPQFSGGTSESESPEETTQFVIAGDEDEDGEVSPKSKAFDKPEANRVTLVAKPTLGEKLISCAIDLLFCCGFTLPSKIQIDYHKINYVIWEKGIGATSDAGPANGLESNRVEVLRFLLVMLSKQIYSTPAKLLTSPSPYSLVLVQRTARRHVLTILCSLLNTAMNSPKPVIPTSAGDAIGSVASSLPYNHLVFKGDGAKELLVASSLQTLVVLLDCRVTSPREPLPIIDDSDGTASSLKANAFRYFIAKLHRSTDFEFIIEGIFGIMEQHMSSVNNVLPGSRKPVPYILEAVLFVWKILDLNKKFRNYILGSGKGVRLFSYLLCYCMDAKDKPQQHGTCRAISYILQFVSSEKAFNDKLPSPMTNSVPVKWTTQGNIGDFMIGSICAIISTNSGQLRSIYPSLIIALSNSSTSFKDLSVVSSNKLISLLASFSNPLFLFSDEGHPRLLFFLLEVFNGILQNGPSSNPNVTYAIIRSHKLFEELGTFTLASGLNEIKRLQLLKEAQKQADGKKGRKGGFSDVEKRPTAHSRLSKSVLSFGSPLESQSSDDVLFRGDDSEMLTATQPLMSPSGEEFAMALPVSEEGVSQSGSEKARGKMRASSEDAFGGLESAGSPSIGRNGFVPTQEWVSSWQQGLPLDTVLVAISELLPKIQELQARSSKNNLNDVSSVIDVLRATSLTNILPSNPAPSPRRFVWTDSSTIWLTSLLWGEIYVRNMTPLGIWNATNVRLFHVKHTQSQSRQITDAVSSVVGGLGGLLGRNSGS